MTAPAPSLGDIHSAASAAPAAPVAPNPAAPNPATFNPTGVPLAAPDNSSVAPASGDKKARPANRMNMEKMIEQYHEAKKNGIEIALADLFNRIIQLGYHGGLMFIAVTLTAATAGAASPFLIYAIAATGVAIADLGCSGCNLVQRLNGKEGNQYHGDSIAALVKLVMTKMGVTDPVKIENYTNYISNVSRMCLGGLTMPANALHRPGTPYCMVTSQISPMQRMLVEQALKDRKKEREEFCMQTGAMDSADSAANAQPAPSQSHPVAAGSQGGPRPDGGGNGGNGGNGSNDGSGSNGGSGPNGGNGGNSTGPAVPPNSPPPAPNSGTGSDSGAGGTGSTGSSGSSGNTRANQPADGTTNASGGQSQVRAATEIRQKAAAEKNTRLIKQVEDIKQKLAEHQQYQSEAIKDDGVNVQTDSNDAIPTITKEQATDVLQALAQVSEESAEKQAEAHSLTCRMAGAKNLSASLERRTATIRA